MATKIKKKLTAGAKKHHLKKGSASYNKYVYGTGSRIQARKAKKK